MVYREIIEAGIVPSIDVLSQVLGCLQIPHDSALKSRLIENIGVSADSSRSSNLCSLIDGFGEYDPRAFSLLEVCANMRLFPYLTENFQILESFERSDFLSIFTPNKM